MNVSSKNCTCCNDLRHPHRTCTWPICLRFNLGVTIFFYNKDDANFSSSGPPLDRTDVQIISKGYEVH